VEFQQEETTAEASTQEFWVTAMRQLRALAKRNAASRKNKYRGSGCPCANKYLTTDPESTHSVW
jgi:hypothetical protein